MRASTLIGLLSLLSTGVLSAPVSPSTESYGSLSNTVIYRGGPRKDLVKKRDDLAEPPSPEAYGFFANSVGYRPPFRNLVEKRDDADEGDSDRIYAPVNQRIYRPPLRDLVEKRDDDEIYGALRQGIYRPPLRDAVVIEAPDSEEVTS